ncbi:MAG: WYL domain-containing protein [Proteobacteria bacterium]|nr:WYL domain-containing protein [Pseudomonadota bacterium]
MRASRLLTMLMLLQTRGRMSAQALADEVEVSVRTVYRDADELSAAGVPIYAERGRAGGFQLLDGWRTKLTGLTPEEAQAMFLTGLPGPAAELGLGEAMAAAQLKLITALPADWREDARRVSSRFHLDPAGWYRGADRADRLPAVARAVWSERRLRLTYESWSGVVARTVDPLGLVLKAGAWYLIAAVEGGARTYRVSNILELEATEEAFTRPADFDLAAFWTASTARFEAKLHRDEAVVRLSGRGFRILRQEAAAAVVEALDRAETPADEDGWRKVTLPIESVEHAAGQFGRLGAEVEVLFPLALRERMTEAVRRLAALYGA